VIEINDTVLDPADYRLILVNAAQQGRPWTAIEILPRSAVKPTEEDVKVTANGVGLPFLTPSSWPR
jgi:hypothetical protein